MEKFGIFELLDALSALTDQGEQTKPAEAEEHTKGKKMPDDAFRAPSYGQIAGTTANTPPHEETQGGGAIDGFLARHDQISRKVKK